MERLNAYRVFIASPSGLEHERQRFREVLVDLNEDDAFERGCCFIPYGWELTLAGTGRPQSLINRDIERSDYLLLVLWDRWGTPPSADGEFTSGTEEEFFVAMQCLSDPTRPMREVVVLFKGASTRQLSDPGKELTRVLEFKQQLETEKTVLYSTFDSLEEFARHVRRHAHSWMREDEGGPAREQLAGSPQSTNQVIIDGAANGSGETGEAAALSAGHSEIGSIGDAPDTAELVQRAESLAENGHLSEAESLLARAVIDRNDVTALTAYARFLRRTGRLDKAAEISEALRNSARAEADAHGEIEALSNLAIIDRKRGRLQDADNYASQGIQLASSLGDAGRTDLAYLYDQQGLTARKRGELRAAQAHHEQALQIRRDDGDRKGVARSLSNMAPLLRQLGDIAKATEMQDEAVAIFESLSYERGLAPAYAGRGELHVLAGDRVEAGECFAQSLALNERLGNPEGIAMNLMQLGRLALQDGNVSLARDYAERGLASEDVANRPEGRATALQLHGLVLAAEGQSTPALAEFQKAAEIYGRCDHIVGLAFVICDAAHVELSVGLVKQATESVAKAKRTAEGLEHVQLWELIDAIQAKLASTMAQATS